MLARFGGEPIFDLARAEFSRADGHVYQFNYRGESYPCLVPEYSSDGGHLNQAGLGVAAAEFLSFLRRAVGVSEHGNGD
ncbi:MAG: hypothetical protein ABFR97_05130 [Thermodesulfobacteriota bacterium]